MIGKKVGTLVLGDQSLSSLCFSTVCVVDRLKAVSCPCFSFVVACFLGGDSNLSLSIPLPLLRGYSRSLNIVSIVTSSGR